MKKSLVLASLLAISSSAMAMDVQYFVGADVSSAKGKSKIGFDGTATINGVSYTNGSVSEDENDIGLGLKVGAIFNKNHRTSLNYTGYKFNETKLKALSLNYDYIFNAEEKFKPFVGAHMGQATIELDSYDDTAMMYGIQGGALYAITDNIEFELGLSYSVSNAKAETPKVSGTYSGITLTNASAYIEAENLTKIYLGVNYRF